MEMGSWKKVASVFVLSASAALLGTACAAEVEVDESTAPLAPSAQTETEATEEAESALTPEQPDGWYDGWDHRGGRHSCVRWCRQKLWECRGGYDYDDPWDRDDWHGGRHGGRCRWQYEQCMYRCGHGYGY
jgi:hypothetical protein